MVTITKTIRTLFVFISVHHFSLYSFSPKKFMNNLWQKKEQEYVHKDLPLEDKSTVELYTLGGKITVKAWNQKKIIIEAEKEGTQEELKNTTIGIKTNILPKIVADKDQEKPSSNSKPESKTAHVTITTRVIPDQNPATVNYNLMIPEHCALTIDNKQKGSVKIKHLQGALDISLAEGDIEVADSTKAVTAKTGKGTIKLKQKKFSDPSSIFLHNDRGNIQLYLPRGIHATVHARTSAGVVTSKHPIKRETQPVPLNEATWEKDKREVDGTIGAEGAPVTLEATKGNISIEEY